MLYVRDWEDTGAEEREVVDMVEQEVSILGCGREL